MTNVAATPSTALDRGIRIGNREITSTVTSEVVDPYAGTVIGRVSQASADQALDAVSAAYQALDQPIPAHERAAILDRIAHGLVERREELAAMICTEVGKPISMARGEVDRAVTTYQLSSAVARLRSNSTVAMDATVAGEGKLGYLVGRPIGVVTAITPFNFPLNLVAHKLAPALAAGCPVVLKPAPQGPFSAFLLADICEAAGLPEGYLSVVPGDPREISAAIIEDPRVAAISFTGSAAVGWHIASTAPRKKVLLELGNASPAIVEPDADLDRAAALLTPNAFGFAGQTCVSVQRVYAHADIHDALVEKLIERSGGIGVGDPRNAEVTCGPVIDDGAAERTLDAIGQATELGASVHTGGERRSDGVLPPTILSGVSQRSDLMQKEAFAPVLSVLAVDGFDQAVEFANDSVYGLQAAIFTSDISKALRATERLDFGGVLVNEAPAFRTDNMPYGGVRDSGNTKEGPEWTAAELTVNRLCILSK
ncbi:aldehyde dehydrogenase family protein [Nocardioides sp. NPDC023903]|uniref:aldehyde dehydrogenase family protein n=1 Tax=Nocardioides sp. NPDC023903 TaxID=3157195 RepID=UPI00340BC598